MPGGIPARLSRQSSPQRHSIAPKSTTSDTSCVAGGTDPGDLPPIGRLLRLSGSVIVTPWSNTTRSRSCPG